MKKQWNRLLSFTLAMAMLIGFFPVLELETSAAAPTNTSSADALSALGIDTGAAPEGYDPDSIDNPYGRNTIEVTPVKELYTIGLESGIQFDETKDTGSYKTSQTGGETVTGEKSDDNALQSTLYGDNLWGSAAASTDAVLSGNKVINKVASGKTKTTGNYAVINSGTHNSADQSYSTSGYLTSPNNATTDLGGFSFAMSDVATGNFDSNQNALSTQTVMVYTTDYSANGGLYLRFGDAKGTYGSAEKELLSKSKQIGNPKLEILDAESGISVLAENFVENPYQLKNYLQVTTGDWNGDGTDEVAVYIPEVGNSRIVVYALQTTSSDDKKTAYQNPDKWGVAWTYYLREGDVVSNMVSLVSGDVDQDGIDDLACTWGYYYGPTQNQGSRAVVMFGGKGSNVLKRSQEFSLTYGTSNIVRASFVFGDLAGSGQEALILCGQSDADLKAGNTYSRYVAMYYWNGSNFTSSVEQNFNLFAKNNEGKYLWSAMDTSHRIGDAQNKFYSLPLCVANTAIMTRGISETGGDLLYFDSLIISYGDSGLSLNEAWDAGSTMTGKANTEYVEYSAAAGDLSGVSGAAAFITLTQTMIQDTEKTTSYTETGAHQEAVYRTEYYYKNWWNKLWKIKSSRQVFDTWKTVNDTQTINIGYKGFTAGATNLLVVDRTAIVETGYYTNRTEVNSSYAVCLANTDHDSSYMNYSGKHYYTYTDPQVLTVLASPPYFSDLLNRNDLSGNYAESTTSYSSSTGSGGGSVGATTISVGAYVSFEQEISVFGISIGKVEAEATFTTGFTWETEHTSTLEQTVSYSATSGEDKVAFYSIPMEIYEYTSYVPDGKGGYTEVVTAANIPHEASVKLLDLSEYEAIAEDYSVLPHVADSVLTHTNGDPSTYPTNPGSYGKKLIAEYKGTPASVGYTSKDGGDTITQEIAMSKESSNSYIGTASLEAKAGAGAGGVTVGVVAGFEGGGGSVKISTSGNSFSGELQAMPAEAEAYGYGMNWRIFCYRYEDKNTSFPVVSYAVSEVSQPSSLPDDFSQDIAKTTKDSVTLTWNYDKFVSGFQIYRYYEFPDGGGSYRLDYVPFSAGTANSDGTYSFSYTDKGLSPYTEYAYQIQTENTNSQKKTSIYSEPLICRTKTEVGYPEIAVSGVENNKLVIYPDSIGTASVSVAEEGKYKSLSFQWQKRIDGTWSNIAGAKTKDYTITNASSADQGDYRCLVNAIYYDKSTANNYYISAYSTEFGTAYSKRTPSADLTLKAQNYGTGSEQSQGIHAQIELHSANVGNTTAPTGTVTFIVTGADYGFSKTVALTESTGTKSFDGESKYYAEASVDISSLPNGAYTVNYYYSGDRVFKDAQSDLGKMAVIGENVTGYLLALRNGGNETVTTFTYGDTITPVLYQMSGANSELTEVSSGVTFELGKDGTTTPFTSGVKTPNVGAYTLKAMVGGNAVAESSATVTKKPIVVSVEDKDNVKAEEIASNPPVILCKDLSDNNLNPEDLKALKFTYSAVNSGLNPVNLENGIAPGKYTVTPSRLSNPDAGMEVLYGNYDMTFVSGTYTVIGLTYQLTVKAMPYTDSSGSRTVGTAGISTASGTSASLAKGESVQLYANPNSGYEVDYWKVAVTGGNTTQYSGTSLPNANRLNLTMEAAATTVEVYFKTKAITLTATADKGGVVSCSDEAFSSGAHVRTGAEFEFTAKPMQGYHFKEWQYSEVGFNPTYPAGNSHDDGTNTLLVSVGTNTIGVKAIFERDKYALTLEGELSAFYMKPSEIAGQEAIKTAIFSGDSVPGDTEITVSPKTGYQAAENAFFQVNGSNTDKKDRYTFKIEADTSVSLATQRNQFGISTSADHGSVVVQVNGEIEDNTALNRVEGGSSVRFTARADRGYHFVKWIVNNEDSKETSGTLSIAELGENLTVTAVFEASTSYQASSSITPKTRGTMLYTLYNIYGEVIGTEESEMPQDGLTVFQDESILFKVRTNSGSMVEQWIYNTDTKTSTAAKTYPGGKLTVNGNISMEAILVASTSYTFYFMPSDDKGGLEASADGTPVISGGTVPGGSEIVLSASPSDTYMVDYWTLTDGNMGTAENTTKLVDENGFTVVNPVYTIDALRGYKTARVHYTELFTHKVELSDGASGSGLITYVTPIKAGEDGKTCSLSEAVRNGGTVIMTLTPNENYSTTVDKLREAIKDKANEDAKVSVSLEDDKYTVTVQNLTKELTIDVGELFVKGLPELSADNITVTYTGEPVSASTIKGSAIVKGTKIDGTWSFIGTPDLTNANSGISVQVKFTPDEIENYSVNTCSIMVTIQKAKPVGAPTYKAITSSGKTLTDAELSIGTITPAGGSIAWDMAGTTEVKANTPYTWSYTPSDTQNYHKLTGEITLYSASTGGGGGGGAGGGGGGATGEQGVTVPISVDGNSVDIKATTSDSSVTITEMDTSSLINMIGESKANTKVKLDLSGLKQTVDTVSLPTDAVKEIAVAAADKTKTVDGLTIKLTDGEAEFDSAALSAISNQAKGSNVQLDINKIEISKLSSEQQKAMEGMNVYGGVDVRLTSDKKGISDFQGGKVTLKVPFPIPSEMEAKQFAIWYVAEDGKKTKLDTAYQDGALVATLSHFSEYVIVYHEVPFSDVPMDAYFANAVEWAVKNSITNGTTETTFGPDTTCTRAQTVVFLWRAAGSPKPKAVNNPFTDVKEDAYYYDAVLWAVENGITSGTTASSFSPDATVTRAQVVTFQWRSAKAPVLDAENPFQDVAKDLYCYNAVLWAAREGVTGGLTATTFGPENDCTRGQIVTFLHRYFTKQVETRGNF